MRLLHASLSLDEAPLYAQFDLGLVLLASSRSQLALPEYERAVKLASSKHILRQRGLYYVALFDLVQGARKHGFGPEGDKIFKLLRARVMDSGVNITELSSWLGDELPRNEASPKVTDGR